LNCPREIERPRILDSGRQGAPAASPKGDEGQSRKAEVGMSRWCSVSLFASAAFAASISAARTDQFPTLNVAPVCHGITAQSDLQEGFRTVTFDFCMKAEQEDRQAMIKEWSTFSASDKAHCIAEATMGGESSYTDLITCLEMSRDVRLLKKANKSDQSTEGSPHQRSRNGRHHRESGS
jgi:hypothetical protein